LNRVGNIEGRVDCSFVWDLGVGYSRLSVERVNFVEELVLSLFSLSLKLLINGVWTFALFEVSAGGGLLLLNLDIVGLIHVYFLLVHEVGSLGTEADWMTTVIGLSVWVWLWLLLYWFIFLFLLLLLPSIWIGVCWILSVQVLHVTTIVVIILLLLGLSLDLLLFFLWLEVFFFAIIVEKSCFVCHLSLKCV